MTARSRRVIVGLDGDGRSAVVEDGVTTGRAVGPNALVVDEIWRQECLPSRIRDDGTLAGEMESAAPTNSVAVKVFTLPPDIDEDTKAYVATLGDVLVEENVGHASGISGMNQTDSVSVATVVSGEAYLVLEAGEVRLRRGDSVVLSGRMHTWHNPSDEAATMVCTVFHQKRSRT